MSLVVCGLTRTLKGLYLRFKSSAQAAQQCGELLLGGAFSDPVDRALLVFRAADASIAEAFARDDPYVINGLVTGWHIRQWNVVTGDADRRQM